MYKLKVLKSFVDKDSAMIHEENTLYSTSNKERADHLEKLGFLKKITKVREGDSGGRSSKKSKNGFTDKS